MTALALKHNAVNLSQGFPDFDGPGYVKHAAHRAIDAARNQYARSAGELPLVNAIARRWLAQTAIAVDPLAEVTVTSGCTEALAAAMLGLLNPGDEIILFEPYYDSYLACAAMAGATPRFVTIRPSGLPPPAPAFSFDPQRLADAVTPRTRAILLNTPHNPTGKVFSRDELAFIAELAERHDLTVIVDEVYERLVYNDALPHVHFATLPGMWPRTITLSSLGKTFSLTGWKIGWAVAPAPLTAAVRAAHQFLTFATATPFQHAAAEAIDGEAGYLPSLLARYTHARAFLADALRSIGFAVHQPDGAYFIMADHTPFNLGDDAAFCRNMVQSAGVAAIPPSVFYSDPALGKPFVRFAFCKRPETLAAAADRLRAWLRP